MADTRYPDSKTNFTFTSVLLESQRLSSPVECKGIVTDFDVYEHIDKPYLTAKLVLIDSEKLIENVDFLGGEKFTISIKSLKPGSRAIVNCFYVTDIPTIEKINNDVQVVEFQLLEDLAYFSNVQIISRTYSGKISEILRKISRNYLQNKTIRTNNTDENNIKVIIPNLNPIETLIWLKRDAKTSDGYPFFLYSTLAKNDLQFFDLGAMLITRPINYDVPYRTHSAAANSNTEARNRNIISANFSRTATLFNLIANCVIGSQYEYIDSANEKRNIFHFDVVKDLFKPLINTSTLKPSQNNPPVSPRYTYENTPFNELNSSYVSKIGGGYNYRTSDNTNYILGYGEEKTLAGYKAKVISKAMDKIIRSEPLKITVDGSHFIDGDKHSTIGNLLNIEIPATKPEAIGSNVDQKKSGEYLMFAARHSFKKEKYDLSLTCVKLGRRRG